MILILTSSSDLSSFHVFDWLNVLGENYMIINDLTLVKLESIELNNKEDLSYILAVDGECIHSENITSYWYRRYELNVYPIRNQDYLSPKAYHHLCYEKKAIQDFLNIVLKNKKHVNSFITQDINKLHCLSIAKDVGLRIPNTIVTTNKSQIQDFEKQYILSTKVIQEALMFNESRHFYYCYNNIIEPEVIKLLPRTFFPSLVQQYVEKKIELRIFYINKRCYSMAIFSQENDQTKVDFRRYDFLNPNRNVTFKLPKQIEKKIIKFMKIANLNSGSIDMVLTPKNEYVFLEVNPIGQFGFVSSSCNYHLEKEIAENLISDYNI